MLFFMWKGISVNFQFMCPGDCVYLHIGIKYGSALSYLGSDSHKVQLTGQPVTTGIYFSEFCNLGVHHQDAGMWILGKSLFWVADSQFLLASSYGGKRARELSMVSFPREQILLMKAPPLWPNHFPRAPLPRPTSRELGLPNMSFGGRT